MHVAVNLLPSGWENIWVPGLAGLAFSWRVRKVTNIDKKVFILMLLLSIVYESFVYLLPDLQI